MSTAQQAAFDKALLNDFDSIAGAVATVDVRKVSFRAYYDSESVSTDLVANSESYIFVHAAGTVAVTLLHHEKNCRALV